MPDVSRLFCAALVAAALGACTTLPEDGLPGAGGDPLELTVEPTPARVGQDVELTLSNRSNRQVGYNLCPSVLQRQVGGAWQTSPVRFTEACTMELRVLEPGARGTFRHPLPAGLQAGTYRFGTAVEWPLGGDRGGVYSAPFEVVS